MVAALGLAPVPGHAQYFGRNQVQYETFDFRVLQSPHFGIHFYPSIEQLTRDASFFPYRYGQALWAYIGGRYGDGAVVQLYRASLRFGVEGALRRVLGLSSAQISRDWHASTRAAYQPLLQGRTHPDSGGDRVLVRREDGALNVLG